MTLLGKLLVLLNLVMSVVFLGFAVHVFSASGDVQLANKKLTDELGIEKKAKAQIESSSTNLQKELTEQKDRYENNAKIAASTIDEQNKQLTSLKDDLQSLRQQMATATTSDSQSTAIAVSRQSEVVELRKIRDEQIKQNTVLMEKVTSLEDNFSKMKNERDLVNSRNQELVTNVKLLQNWIAANNNGKIPSDVDLVAKGENTPVPDVEGVVTKVESDGKLVTLSIGEDDGLRKGHILQIWREKPNSQYIGQLQIVDTKGRVSIARPLSAVSGVIKENDKVAPSIIRNARGN